MRTFLHLQGFPRGLAGDGGDGGGAGGGDGGGGGWTPPDGLPEEYRGADANETLGKLLGGFKDVSTRFGGLRDKLAGMPKAPDSPDKYLYEPSEKLKPWFGDMNQNKVYSQARTAFHKHNVPQEAFAGIIEDLYGPLVDQGVLGKPFDPKAELTVFRSEMGLDAAGTQEALKNTESFAKGLLSQLKGVPEKLKADVEARLMEMTDDAAGNVLLHALSARMAENGIRIGGEGERAGMLTAEDLKKLDADPRIDPSNRNHTDPAKRFDEALRKQYDEAYDRIHGRRGSV